MKDLSDEQIKLIEKNGWIIFGTADKNNQPHCVIVLPSKIEKQRIILSNIQMKTSIKNLEENNKCCINVYSQEDDTQIKINGYATIEDSSKLYTEIKEYEEINNLPPKLKVNSIIIVNIQSIEVSQG